MKRNTESNQYEITKCNPWFFWTECFFCNHEFRREAGWRFSLQTGGGQLQYSHSCAECSKTKQHLEGNIKTFLSRKPKAPQATPRKP